MNYLVCFCSSFANCKVRAGAVELTLYVLAKSVFVVLFNRFNRNAYAAE